MPKTQGVLAESNRNNRVIRRKKNEINKINRDFYSAIKYCIDLLLKNGYISQTKNENISREAARLGVHMYERMMKMKDNMASDDEHVSDDDDDADDDIDLLEDDEDNEDDEEYYDDEDEDDIKLVDDDSMSMSFEAEDDSIIVKEELMDINEINIVKETNNAINKTTESTIHSTQPSRYQTKLSQLNCENNEPLTTTKPGKRQLKSPEDIAKQDKLSEINDIVTVKCRKQIGLDGILTNKLICGWAEQAALKVKDSTFKPSIKWLSGFKKSNGIFIEDAL